jgi:hypothetical protein
MRQVIGIGARRPTLPGSACAHRGSGAAGWLGCARTWPVLVARSFGLRPYPRQVSDDGRNVSAHPAQVRQSLATRGPYRRTGGGSTKPVLQRVARQVPLASLFLGGRPRDQWSPSPPASTPLGLPARLRPQSAAAVLSVPNCRSRPVVSPAPAPWQARRWLGRASAQRAAGTSRSRCWTCPAQRRSPPRAPRRCGAPRNRAAWRLPRSAPSTPTWLTASLARSTGPSRLERQLPIE